MMMLMVFIIIFKSCVVGWLVVSVHFPARWYTQCTISLVSFVAPIHSINLTVQYVIRSFILEDYAFQTAATKWVDADTIITTHHQRNATTFKDSRHTINRQYTKHSTISLWIPCWTCFPILRLVLDAVNDK